MNNGIYLNEGSISSYATKRGMRYRWQLMVPTDPDNPEGLWHRASAGGFKSKSQAQKALSNAKENILMHKPAVSPNISLADFCETWLSSLDLANSTLLGYRRIIRNHLAGSLGKMSLRSIQPAHLNQFYLELRKSGRRDFKDHGGPLSPNSVAKVHSLLGAVFSEAKDLGLIYWNPIKDSKKVKGPSRRAIREEKPELETFTREELRLVSSWLKKKKDPLYVLWMVFIHTGMRRSEALALTWADIDFEQRRILVRRAIDTGVKGKTKSTKNGLIRRVAIGPQMINILAEFKREASEKTVDFVSRKSLVFGVGPSQLRSPNDISAQWARRLREMQAQYPGLPWVTLKGLRHTHATLLMQTRESPKVIQERLGHTDIKTTLEIYSHATQDIQEDAVRRFELGLESEKKEEESDE